MLHDLSEKDVEMLARFLPDLRNEKNPLWGRHVKDDEDNRMVVETFGYYQSVLASEVR